jgi:O-6-methylguanine DNA methyltransferase
MTFLTTATGKPFAPGAFTNWFGSAVRAAGLPLGLSAHGLRKAMCRRFQREVWTALRAIPVGETTTYGRLAALLGRPKARRAVGMANGANPVGVVVPCHRVIGANATLTGYRGGIARKRWLLEHEGVALRECRRADVFQCEIRRWPAGPVTTASST